MPRASAPIQGSCSAPPLRGRSYSPEFHRSSLPAPRWRLHPPPCNSRPPRSARGVTRRCSRWSLVAASLLGRARPHLERRSKARKARSRVVRRYARRLAPRQLALDNRQGLATRGSVVRQRRLRSKRSAPPAPKCSVRLVPSPRAAHFTSEARTPPSRVQVNQPACNSWQFTAATSR